MSASIRITRVLQPDELARQIVPKMANLGAAMGKRVQRLVPKRTFNLHDTIAVDTKAEGGVVTTEVGVGGNGEAPYWEHVERGTSRQKAQPYLRPALLQTTNSDLK